MGASRAWRIAFFSSWPGALCKPNSLELRCGNPAYDGIGMPILN
jgi:hypothetical protein